MPALPGRVRKHYIPLESNPDVFNELSHKLGLDERLEFVDVLSLNDPDLLAFVPRPALALVLVFPTTEAYEARVKEQDSERNDDAQPGGDVAYFKQTVNNACGLYALLHAVCNGEAKDRLSTNTSSPVLLF
jgi:ubiquitin carboxyl-terminal hydrolase L3